MTERLEQAFIEAIDAGTAQDRDGGVQALLTQRKTLQGTLDNAKKVASEFSHTHTESTHNNRSVTSAAYDDNVRVVLRPGVWSSQLFDTTRV